MRLPLAPATLRAGGWISAGMISTVHTPLPMRAAIEPNDWPHFCAPSPESLMISTMCSSSVRTFLAAVPASRGISHCSVHRCGHLGRRTRAYPRSARSMPNSVAAAPSGRSW